MAYAVIQLGGPVYGVGETEGMAKQDAREWLDRDSEIGGAPNHNSVDGDICLVECTAELMAQVRNIGGDIVYHINDDGLACLPVDVE